MNRILFGSLYVKLFAAIAGAIGVLTLAAYLVFSWSFEQGFVGYLHRADEVRLERMVGNLRTIYAKEGGWTALASDRDRWIDLARESLGLPRSSEPGGGDTVTARALPLTIDPRLMLFDSRREQLIGRPEYARRAVLKPVVVNDATVGFLGYVPRPEIVQSVERVYLERQHVAFGSIAMGMLIASLLLAASLAYWLTRRTRALARGTHALTQGDYSVRLDAGGHDELSRLARDFNALAAALAAARDARQQWIADIAHELRTPLAVLRGEIESLQDGVRPLDQAAIASLASEATRLARLVEDLHTLSMSDMGALSYRREPVPVAEIIEDVLDGQRHELEQCGLPVQTDVDAEAWVHADASRLAQVFGNLLQNSTRYTDAPGEIRVGVQRKDGAIHIRWEDTAPGVATSELPRLTDRLYRVEASRNRAAGGSGLGLAIAKAIVEGHGGTLSAAASELGGLAIDIVLPAHQRGHERA